MVLRCMYFIQSAPPFCIVGIFFKVNVSLPSWERELLIPVVRMPRAVIAPMMENTPTTIESIVRNARSLFVRNEFNAIFTFSFPNAIIHISVHRQDRAAMLLMPEQFRKLFPLR